MSSQKFAHFLPYLLILIFSAGIAGFARQKDGGNYPKVDAIAFYTAGVMAREGQMNALYKIQLNSNTVEMESPATGAIPGSPMEFTLLNVLPGEEYSAEAARAGYKAANPPVFVYLPIFAYLFIPATFVSFPTFTFVFDFLMVGCLLVAMFQFLKNHIHCPKRLGIYSAVILCLLLFSHPFQFSLYCGQISPLFAAIIIWSMLPDKNRYLAIGLGILVGLITAMKFFPALLIVGFWAQKNRSRFVAASITFAVLLITSLFIDSFSIFKSALGAGEAMLEGSRLWSGNQSIFAMFERFSFSTNLTQMPAVAVVSSTRNMILTFPYLLTLLLAPSVLLIMLIVSFSTDKNKRQDEDAKLQSEIFSFIGGVFLVGSPIVWSHYLLFSIPMSLYLLFKIMDSPFKILNPREKFQKAILIAAFVISTLAIHHHPDVWVGVNNQYLSGFGEVLSSTIYRVLIALPTLGYLAQLLACMIMFVLSLRKKVKPKAELTA